MLAAESLRLDRTLAGPTVEAVISGCALLLAWRRRASLRLVPLVLLVAGFQLGWAAIHLALGVHGDPDVRVVYPGEGQALLHGSYPASPYPPGAVGLFAAEVWLGGGVARTANALLMVPFGMLCVVGIWSLHTRWSSWLAAFVALWPLDAFFWEFRFDLVPAAAVVAGAVLANRGRWSAAGWTLGVGALTKWTPGLTAVALAVWLLASGRRESAKAHMLCFAIPVILVCTPLLILQRRAALAPYRGQSGREITGESLPYLVFRALGLAAPGRRYYGVAQVPSWSTSAAVAAQALALLGLVLLVATARDRAAAIALAAVAPAVFLLTNRVFSPQFFVVIVAACAVAAALTLRRPQELIVVATMLGAATVANATLYPRLSGPVAETPGWTYASAAALLLAAAAVAVLVRAGVRRAPVEATES